jgi:uncharacterized membrane protein YgdD (TMEM256/DUF423 family)
VRGRLTFAAAVGFAGVALGAFGAHALAPHLGDARRATWGTAVDYHLVHALALLALAAMPFEARAVSVARWAFGIGVALFCGSLYLLALTEARWLGIVTPFGGAAFLVGWASIAVAGWRRRS